MAGFRDKTSLYSNEEEEESEDDSEEEREEESEEEGEDVPTKEPRKDAVYNVAGLHDKLEEIGWPDNLDWMENLRINYKREQEIDVNDDLAREMAFYTQALEGTREAYEKLQAMGIPFLRPSDYYAEMVKSDTHMLKVKDKLLFQKKQMEETEERRKARESKKLSKAIQVEKLKERAKKKKHDIESVKTWRKMRQNSGFADGGKDEMPFDFGNGDTGGDGPIPLKKNFKRGVAPGDRSGGKARHAGMQSSAKGGKRDRDFKDAKFGHGGRKRLRKQNTAESAADFSGFGKGGDRRGKQKGKK